MACHIIHNLVNICPMTTMKDQGILLIDLLYYFFFFPGQMQLITKLCSSGCSLPCLPTCLLLPGSLLEPPHVSGGIPATGSYNSPLRIHLWLLLPHNTPHINIQHPWLAVEALLVTLYRSPYLSKIASEVFKGLS